MKNKNILNVKKVKNKNVSNPFPKKPIPKKPTLDTLVNTPLVTKKKIVTVIQGNVPPFGDTVAKIEI